MTKQQLTFITGNEHKLKEARAILDDREIVGSAIDLVEIQSTDAHEIVAAKLDEASKHHFGACIVEDTSLHIKALGGLPGPLVKWFVQDLGTEGLAELVYKYDQHDAEAVCLIGHVDAQGHKTFHEGRVAGQIVLPCGDSDFGWDPIFVPDGSAETFAQMSPEKKNAVSHRRRALEALRTFLTT